MSVISESKIKADDTIRAQCFHPSGTFVEFKKEEIEQSIPDRFEQMVQTYPNRLAVKTKTCALTYEQLNQAANRVAHAILAERGEGEEPVALLFEQGASVIAAILGALKAGKIYVPLDPSDPTARNASMLEDSQARLTVSNNHNMTLRDGLTRAEQPVLNLDNLNSSLPDKNPGLSVSADTIAYIMYTSGSTGKPKAVMQNHRNVLHNTMVYTNSLHVCADDRLTLFHSCSNGASINNLFGALLNGAALFPFHVKKDGTSHLATDMVEEKITIYHSIPALFRNFVDSITGLEDFSNLRLVHLSGEAATKKDLDLYRKHFSPDCMFVHRLGSREAQTVFLHLINRRSEITGNIAPVGYPVEDMQVLLLDEDNKQAGYNEVGEIVIRSRYLSPGYWRDPDRTQATFVPVPEGSNERMYRTGDLGRRRPDGSYEHLGRKDSRVKVRGYRIEITEIEIVLLDLDLIKEAVVVVHGNFPGEQRLVAYTVPNGYPAPTVSKLRGFLKEKLPDYMIPSAFVMLDALPLTPTGKVDRQALPPPGKYRPELDTPCVAPRTPIEEELAKIWAEVLSLDQVGIHDNFFDLGGHSLAATRVISRVIKTFKVELPIRSLFESPTVAEMVVVITRNEAKKVGQEDLARMLAELETLSDKEVQHLLAQQMREKKA
ncbi:MAG: amino acid adenylation domain-containing protein [Candidatus Binatia bacterium]